MNKQHIRHAVILAGGRGERLRPLTQDRPKCMVEVLGTPILSYQLNWLRTYGIRKVVIACGYLHESIQAHYGDGAKMGLELSYSVEHEPLGRGGALKSALKKLACPGNPVIAMNGDSICNLSIADLGTHHAKTGAMATVVTTSLRSQYGIIDLCDDGRIRGFREKPELPYSINSGIYALRWEIIEHLPDKGDHEESTFPSLAEEGALAAFPSTAFWRTVDTVKDVNELRVDLQDLFLGTLFQRHSTMPALAESFVINSSTSNSVAYCHD